MGSLGGSHGARPATAVTAGWPPTRSAVRPPIECPTRPIGRPGKRSASWSSAQVASATGDIWSPFQPRTRKRITATAMSKRDSTPICRAKGSIRR